MDKSQLNKIKFDGETVKKTKNFLINGGIYIVLLLLFILIIMKDSSFLSFRNLINILQQSSVKMIIALGIAGIIVTQGTDLSAGRQIGIAGLISATLLQSLANPNRIYKFMNSTGFMSNIGKALGFDKDPTLFVYRWSKWNSCIKI